MSPLIGHLRETGQLTAGLVLRSLLSGNIDFFEQSLAELTELPAARVSALLHDRRAAGFKAVYRARRAAGLDLSGIPRGDRGDARGRFDGTWRQCAARRRMVERVLTSCAGMPAGEVEPLMMLLRRYATEAARDEARLFCDELVEMDNLVPANDIGRAVVAA